MMAPQSSFSGYTTLCELPLKSNPVTPGSKGGGPALVQWTEVQHHPGLVCALTQTSSNPVVILVKPDKVQIQELKALPNKAKVQGMVAMRQPAAPGDPVSVGWCVSVHVCIGVGWCVSVHVCIGVGVCVSVRLFVCVVGWVGVREWVY